jgi:hypothetical protein
MSKPDHILSFATGKDGDQLFIHADAEGLDHLIRTLTQLRRKIDEDVCDHTHLMTDAWAGSELSERSMADGVHVIHHVKIYGWTQEWILNHGLSA